MSTVPLTDTNSRSCTCRTFPVFIGVGLAAGGSALLPWEQEVSTKRIKTKRTADKNRIAGVLSRRCDSFSFKNRRQKIELDLLHLDKAIPLMRKEVIQLLMETTNFKLCLEIDQVIVL